MYTLPCTIRVELAEVPSPRPTKALLALHVYLPLTDGDVIITCKVLINNLSSISIVDMFVLFCPEVRVLPSGSVQVIVGLGRPEAVQVNVAVLGEVTTCDEGYSVMLTETVTNVS